MTNPQRAQDSRWLVVLLAALTAVLALLLPATPASATPSPAAETRVGASTVATAVVVGVHECITAGQRPVRGPSQPQIAAGNCVAAEGVTRGGAGEGHAATVLQGGRPDRQTVFAGHGSYSWGAGDTVVPNGTTVHVYSDLGKKIPDSLGRAIEAGGDVVPHHVYGPGEAIPNYVLRTPDNLQIYSGSTTVGRSTPLSELLQPNMGTCHWAACTSVR